MAVGDFYSRKVDISGQTLVDLLRPTGSDKYIVLSVVGVSSGSFAIRVRGEGRVLVSVASLPNTTEEVFALYNLKGMVLSSAVGLTISAGSSNVGYVVISYYQVA